MDIQPHSDQKDSRRRVVSPLVAIVGRPNVGKSTLFNRLAGRKVALVENVPGVTRDRHYADTEWNGRAFTLIDTGGLLPSDRDALSQQVRHQAQLAVDECDAIILVVDAQAGLTPQDAELAALLRKSGKPLVLAVNKVDQEAHQAAASDFYSLGISELFHISAEHARGLTPLFDCLVSLLAPPDLASPSVVEACPERSRRGPSTSLGANGVGDRIRVALVGRPNVGKSSLLNALLNEARVIVSEQPGTTRDPIDTEIEFQGRKYTLTDTAGIRRRKSVDQRVEQVAVLAAIRAIDHCDVAALILDATEVGVDQDARLAGMAIEKGRGLLLVVNKWDKLSSARQADFREQLKQKMKFVSYAPILFTSAPKRLHVEKILHLASELFDQLNTRASTPLVNQTLADALSAKPAPIAHGRPLRLYFAAQIATTPPTFAISCDRPALIPEHYKRYLANQIRKAFQLKVPIRLLFRLRSRKARASRED